HGPAPPRGPRLLPQGRRRPVRRGRQARAGRLAADEHQRRRTVLHPPRHVRDVPAGRGRAAAAGRGRGPPARPAPGGGRTRLGRGAVDDGHGGARDGGDAVSAGTDVSLFEPPASEAAAPFWEATRRRELVLPWCTDCRRPFWYPREVCPTCLGVAIEWRPAG